MHFKLKKLARLRAGGLGTAAVGSAPLVRSHLNVKCDYCKRPDIQGDRYCCTVCDNYNLCCECFCLNHINKSHEYNHPCVQLSYPVSDDSESFKLDELVRQNADKYFNVDCSICYQKCMGVYIKCRQCYNTHYCYNCWKSERHDPDHTCIVFTSNKLEFFAKGDISMLRPLGNGNFGFVYLAYLKSHECYAACKLIIKRATLSLRFPKRRDREKEFAERYLSIEKELEAYTEIISPYVCKLLGFGGRSMSRMFIVTEYMENGSLEDLIIRNERHPFVSFLDKFTIVYNIAHGLSHIHEKNYIHADIKPKNILITGNLTAKICDLGSIKNMNNREVANKQIGGLYYLPYEFFAGNYDNRVDVYSFGLVVYHLMSGARHTYKKDGSLQLDRVQNIQLNFLKGLIWKATQVNPQKRGFIYNYKDVFMVYVSTLRDLFKKFEFDEYYNLLTLPNKNFVVAYLNETMIQLIEKQLLARLPHDDYWFDIESVDMHDEIKSKLKRILEELKERAEHVTQVKIVELDQEDREYTYYEETSNNDPIVTEDPEDSNKDDDDDEQEATRF